MAAACGMVAGYDVFSVGVEMLIDVGIKAWVWCRVVKFYSWFFTSPNACRMGIKYWRRRSLILNTIVCRLVWGSEIFHLYCREIGHSWRSNKLRRRYWALHQTVRQESRLVWLLEGGPRTIIFFIKSRPVRFLFLSDILCFGSHKFATICLDSFKNEMAICCVPCQSRHKSLVDLCF